MPGLFLVLSWHHRISRTRLQFPVSVRILEKIEASFAAATEVWPNQRDVKAPPTGIATPMMKLAAGLHSQSTAAANSSTAAIFVDHAVGDGATGTSSATSQAMPIALRLPIDLFWLNRPLRTRRSREANPLECRTLKT
ncbi:hypothetical protein HJB51_08595 [Rhizobium lentis]|uniref:hypothetical protein n=1 Tax=Rhizobium lentis TaxID=1138194 RepID=UPI001C8313BF|nr:hypothetical protein [Rhizobium lentis]MBX5044614.1 hypothetical protein [Rhizobium lentis]MBX5053120.1 hypothetical protein [Rhizobium lentis]MBX5069782.1 hypothetical protein [Rhizobium lentis]MBX5108047.1 hypothetical protein [Rhizobium lentis]MBX5113893.1 hypothetical protein [Rhizobium lentis]